MLKLGKLPARKGAVTFKLQKYAGDLPPAPDKAGHRELMINDSSMFANDQIGDCVCADAGHSTYYFNRMAQRSIVITDANVIEMYSAVTGYNPRDVTTDQGTDMQAAASWRRKVGIADSKQQRHKLLAYLDLGTSDRDNIRRAIYYFGGAGIGFHFPDYAMNQFDRGQSWHVTGHGNIEGGHDVFAFAYDKTYIYVMSWGKIVKMTWKFFEVYADECIVYLSPEMFVASRSLEGFDLATLQKDLKNLT